MEGKWLLRPPGLALTGCSVLLGCLPAPSDRPACSRTPGCRHAARTTSLARAGQLTSPDPGGPPTTGSYDCFLGFRTTPNESSIVVWRSSSHGMGWPTCTNGGCDCLCGSGLLVGCSCVAGMFRRGPGQLPGRKAQFSRRPTVFTYPITNAYEPTITLTKSGHRSARSVTTSRTDHADQTSPPPRGRAKLTDHPHLSGSESLDGRRKQTRLDARPDLPSATTSRSVAAGRSSGVAPRRSDLRRRSSRRHGAATRRIRFNLSRFARGAS